MRALVQQIPRVGTGHTLRPHDASKPSELRSLDVLDRHMTVDIRLNPTAPVGSGSTSVTIVHGHHLNRRPAGTR